MGGIIDEESLVEDLPEGNLPRSRYIKMEETRTITTRSLPRDDPEWSKFTRFFESLASLL